MSASLIIAAGYVDIPATHKLALIKLADSASRKTRIGFPGLDALQVWCGASRARVLEILVDLQSWGLLMQVGAGHRNARASFLVFPEAGDGPRSLAARRGEATPGEDAFKGVPAIPGAEELEARVQARPKRKPRGGRAKVANPAGKQEEKGSDGSDPADPERVRTVVSLVPRKGPTEPRKGSERDCKGSEGSDPFRTELPSHTSNTPAASAAGETCEAEPKLFDIPAPPPKMPDPVQLLVGAYVDAVEDSGGIATHSMRGAIGKHAKRLINVDKIELPVLLVAVQRSGAKRDRQIDKYLGAAQETYAGSDSGRRAMFDNWQRIAERAVTSHHQIGA